MKCNQSQSWKIKLKLPEQPPAFIAGFLFGLRKAAGSPKHDNQDPH
jgi:hypothetical protein